MYSDSVRSCLSVPELVFLEDTRTGSSTVRGKYERYLVQVRTTTPRKEYGLERVRNLVMYVHYTVSIVHVESYTYLVREK